jgi:polyhydroxybutyrate depolymerase
MMGKRLWIGASMLACIAGAIAASAPAQDRLERIRQLRARAQGKAANRSDPNETKITAPGTYRFSFVHGGLKREYIAYVPAGLPRDKPAPMLLAMHGGGGDMDFQADNYGLKQKADQAGFIAVFPNGYSRFPSGILATWNAGACCGKAVEQKVDDVGFLKEVMLRVSRQANVDRSRIYATGMSNGGLMAYRLACELPHMVRAIAPVAGTDNSKLCNPSRPVPVIHFHAKDDSHILYTGGSGREALTKTDFVSVPATIEKWVELNRARRQPQRVLSVAGAYCDLHGAGPGGAPVKLCVTESGGHSWPGTPSRRSNKAPSMAISANQLMWDFFQSI